MSDNEKRETHADIIAEMHRFAKQHEYDHPDMDANARGIEDYADRLEAAHKREKRGVACTGYCKATKRVEALALDLLTSAKRKPAGCSDVRWRIELSRRRLAAVGPLDMLPDPDMLA